MKRFKIGDLIHVKWRDSASVDGWEPWDTLIENGQLCETVGWLTHTSKQCITISGTIAYEDRDTKLAACSMIIPRKAVAKMRIVR